MTLVAVLASALCLFFCTAGQTVWPLAWVAPFPVLALAPSLRARSACGAALAAWALGSFSWWVLYRGIFGTLDILPAIVVPALAFAVGVLLHRRALRCLPAPVAVFVFPAFWVAWEFGLAAISPHGTAGSYAYTQVAFLPVMQMASVGGLPAVTFIVMLVPATAAVALRVHRIPGPAVTPQGSPPVAAPGFRAPEEVDVRGSTKLTTNGNGSVRPEPSRRTNGSRQGASAHTLFSPVISVALVPLALLVLVLLFGTVRLLQAPGRARVRVGLVASDAINAATVPERFADAKAVAVASAYAFWGGQMGERGAEIVVLPEKLAQVSAASAPGVYRAFAESAARTHVVMVAGFDQPRRNVAVVWGSDGSVRLRYAKRHLVPGFEAAFERGQEDGLLRLPGAMVAVAICKDLDFVEVGRAASRGGAQLMLVPAWDFVRDGRAHARMAVARGIEGGFAVARSARNGVLTVSDSTGRIVAERPSSPGRAATLVADVPLGQAGTLYARWGDWFAWLMVAVTLALGLWPSNRP